MILNLRTPSVELDATLSLPMPDQLLVLGRGLQNRGTEANSLTAARALAARAYYDQFHPSLVIFSGAGSALATEHTEGSTTEAAAMAEIAALPGARKEERSQTTLENFIYASELLDRDLPIAVLAHRLHLPRALYLGRAVLNRQVIGVAAETFGAMPEPRSHIRQEKKAFVKDRALVLGVSSGDITALRRRAYIAERLKKRAPDTLKRAITGNSIAYQ